MQRRQRRRDAYGLGGSNGGGGGGGATPSRFLSFVPAGEDEVETDDEESDIGPEVDEAKTVVRAEGDKEEIIKEEAALGNRNWDDSDARKKTVFNWRKDWGRVLNAYQNNEVIGQPVFKAHLTEEFKRETFSSASVQLSIAKYMEANAGVTRAQAEAHARRTIASLATDYKNPVVRGLAYVVQKILQQLYKGIHIDQTQLSMVKKIAKKAQEEGISLVLLPTHKSHIDYLVLSFMFFHCNLSLPFIAAGENLAIPIVGQVLRYSGAFFIRRRFDSDPVYRAVFTAYITLIMQRGYNLEFFVEGGRSRSGKLLRPKMGLLRVVTDALLDGEIRDAYMIPINIAYDKVIEAESYVQELLGKPKKKENLQSLLGSAKLLNFNFGRVDVRFAKPFSLRQWMDAKMARRHIDPVNNAADRRQIVSILAYSIEYRMNRTSVAMPTSLVVSAMLTHHGRGISMSQLVAKVEWLKAEIIKRGGRVAKSSEDAVSPTQLVETSLNVLGSLITKQKKLLEPVFTPAKRFELSFYRNQIIHVFLSEGIVACAVYTAVKRNASLEVAMPELLKNVAFLSQLLKLEVIYKPVPDIDEPFVATVKSLINSRVLLQPRDGVLALSTDPAGARLYQFLLYLFWPFIDSYWTVALSFVSLHPKEVVVTKVFVQQILNLAETLYYKGEISFYESISKERVSNALDLFGAAGWNVIRKQDIAYQGMKTVRLTHEYNRKDGKKLRELVVNIGKFRRESKYQSSGWTSLSDDTISAIKGLLAKAKM